MLIALICLGSIGVLGMTWLFPCAGRLIWSWQRTRHAGTKRSDVAQQLKHTKQIAILIPVHNDGAALDSTLSSISRAVAQSARVFPDTKIIVRVGLDGCDDNTAHIAKTHNAEIFEYPVQRGKWLTLRSLLDVSHAADWIVFADCGVGWQENFLTSAIPLCADSEVMAVAPTYRNPSGGIIENLLWSFERHLKRLESASGGPVSAHGATILYRHKELCTALKALHADSWYNDDVVLPLILRTLNPTKRILYVSGLGVFDQAVPAQASVRVPREFNRRKRMVLGNIQWIQDLFPLALKGNLVAALLASRRIFRLFWAYWGLVLVAAVLFPLIENGSSTVLVSVALFLVVVPCLFYCFISSVKQLADSAVASLLAPYYLCVTHSFEKASWK
ncbi:hypothetical protein OAO01_01735 [Oligoflexia bacterium]|nr:hypothetical protein [Oligoflexia bacterium]